MVASVASVNGTVFSSAVAVIGSTQAQQQLDVSIGGVGTNSEKVSISPAATIQLGQDRTIQGGKLINQTDQAYAKQQGLLNKMGGQLQAILKQFPPYGTEDPERVAFLKEFSGLRKEIEALQFPKDPQTEQGLPKGLNWVGQGSVPSLPILSGTSATDHQVADAAAQVQSAYDQVTAQRQALAHSVHTALGGNAYANQINRLS
jgi:hypothetical protein